MQQLNTLYGLLKCHGCNLYWVNTFSNDNSTGT